MNNARSLFIFVGLAASLVGGLSGSLLYAEICNGLRPEINPGPCISPYANCKHLLTETSCPATWACVGVYPYYIPTSCEPATSNVHCVNYSQDSMCYQKADCKWQDPICTQGEWCAVYYARAKDSPPCTPPMS